MEIIFCLKVAAVSSPSVTKTQGNNAPAPPAVKPEEEKAKPDAAIKPVPFVKPVPEVKLEQVLPTQNISEPEQVLPTQNIPETELMNVTPPVVMRNKTKDAESVSKHLSQTYGHETDTKVYMSPVSPIFHIVSAVNS